MQFTTFRQIVYKYGMLFICMLFFVAVGVAQKPVFSTFYYNIGMELPLKRRLNTSSRCYELNTRGYCGIGSELYITRKYALVGEVNFLFATYKQEPSGMPSGNTSDMIVKTECGLFFQYTLARTSLIAGPVYTRSIAGLRDDNYSDWKNDYRRNLMAFKFGLQYRYNPAIDVFCSYSHALHNRIAVANTELKNIDYVASSRLRIGIKFNLPVNKKKMLVKKMHCPVTIRKHYVSSEKLLIKLGLAANVNIISPENFDHVRDSVKSFLCKRLPFSQVLDSMFKQSKYHAQIIGQDLWIIHDQSNVPLAERTVGLYYPNVDVFTLLDETARQLQCTWENRIDDKMVFGNLHVVCQEIPLRQLMESLRQIYHLEYRIEGNKFIIDCCRYNQR